MAYRWWRGTWARATFGDAAALCLVPTATPWPGGDGYWRLHVNSACLRVSLLLPIVPMHMAGRALCRVLLGLIAVT